MPARASLLALSLGLAAAALTPHPALAGGACGLPGYSYAGLDGRLPAHGVSARLSVVLPPRVVHGHAAAWVGVGGAGLGPGGSTEWLQVGLAAFPHRPVKLYYEVARPGTAARSVTLMGFVPVGAAIRVGVLEMRRRPGVWRVWVAGSPVSQPIALPGSHGRFPPTATTETWDGGVPSCNEFVYRFDGVRVASAPGGAWRPLQARSWIQDPGYRVLPLAPSTFLAGRDD